MRRSTESLSMATAAMYFVAIAAVMIASLHLRGRTPIPSEFKSSGIMFFYALAHSALVYGIFHLLLEGVRRVPGVGRRSFLLLSNFLFTALFTVMLVHLVVFWRFRTAFNQTILTLIAEPGFFLTIGVGGVEILGLVITLACMYAAFLGLAVLTNRIGPQRRLSPLWILLPCLVSGGVERLAFGLQEYRSPNSVAAIGHRLPFHGYTRSEWLGKMLGIDPQAERAGSAELDALVSALSATRSQSALVERNLTATNDYNVLYIMVESLRFDMLDPAIMPHVSTLANDPKSFRGFRHFSNGNSTAESMHGIFSGLSALHWVSWSRRTLGYPVIFEIFERLGYELNLFYTSGLGYRGIGDYVLPRKRMNTRVFNKRKRASTRDFNKHDRAGRRERRLEWKSQPLEQDDVEAAEALLASLDARGPGKFVDVIYFYSPHYNYYYEADDALFQPALKRRFMIRSLFARSHPKELFNRYKNAAHFVDRMTQRIIERLEALELLDRTIIVFVGDHGEEFLEHGLIGHSTALNRFQTQVPLVIRAPQGLQSQYTTTSHADLSPTVASLLGIDIDNAKYFGGKDLAQFAAGRDYAVIVDPLGKKDLKLHDSRQDDEESEKNLFDTKVGRLLLVENDQKLYFEAGQQTRPLYYTDLDDERLERPIAEDSFERLREIIRAEVEFLDRSAPEAGKALPTSMTENMW